MNDMNKHLNADFRKVRERLYVNKLPLNLTETEFLAIGSRQKFSMSQETRNFAIDRDPVKGARTTNFIRLEPNLV